MQKNKSGKTYAAFKVIYLIVVTLCVISFVSEIYCALVISRAAISTLSGNDLHSFASVVSNPLTDSAYLLTINSKGLSSPIYLNLKFDTANSRIYAGILSNTKGFKNPELCVFADKNDLGICADASKAVFYTVPQKSLGSSSLFDGYNLAESIKEYAPAIKGCGALFVGSQSLLNNEEINKIFKSIIMQSHKFSKSGNKYSFQIRLADLKAELEKLRIGTGGSEKAVSDFLATRNYDGNFTFTFEILNGKIASAQIVQSKKRLPEAVFEVSAQNGIAHISFRKSLSDKPHLFITLSKSKSNLPKPSAFKKAEEMSIGELSKMGEAFSRLKECVNLR